MRYFVFIGLLISLVACMTGNDAQNKEQYTVVSSVFASGQPITLRLPERLDFITNIGTDTNIGAFGEEICIEVFEFPLWEVGVDAQELQEHLYDPVNVQIMVDDKKLG